MRPVIICVALGSLVLAGCNKTTGTATPVAGQNPPPKITGPSVPSEPELRVRSAKELDFGPGAKARIWDLNGRWVQTLTVKLIIARDGKKEPGTEIKCSWDRLSDNVDAQLVLLLQNGSAFGAKGKRLPSLAIQFNSGSPESKESLTGAAVHDTLPPLSSAALTDSFVGMREVLFHEISGDITPGNTVAVGGTEESLIEASRNNRMVVGVFLEWTR